MSMSPQRRSRTMSAAALLLFVMTLFVIAGDETAHSATGSSTYEFNDSHFHLTNYIQEGIDIHKFLQIMGTKAGRVALFGIPLQQQWSYRVSGPDHGPTYYLQTDSPLYYYSFTDAAIAMAYRSLTKAEQARFDPMITGFNPTDMYAADHIRRVLTTFPGVFSGIGEFTIHKEFVSSKISGDVASLSDPALDRLLDFVADVGMPAIIHNDIDVPFPKAGAQPAYLDQMKDLLRRHPRNTIIWAHTGVGRVIHPVAHHAQELEKILSNPAYAHVYFDISWDEVAKYLVSSPEVIKISADLINRYPDRFLFGTDEVAPSDQQSYTKVFVMYDPLWKELTPEARQKVRLGNYERIFDQARRNVRAWEAKNVKH